MKRKGLGCLLVIAFCAVLFLSMAIAQDSAYQEKRVLVENLVNEAAALIQSQGEAALAIISDKNQKFNTPQAYVFVTSGETGADLLNPAFQEIEGLPANSYTDPETKASQIKIVNAVENTDTAWVEYLWPKPGEIKPVKKVSYLKKMIINGKTRIVGSGFYPQE